MKTSETRGFPRTPVNLSETWAVPPFSAPVTADAVTATGLGAQLPPAIATPAGMATPL